MPATSAGMTKQRISGKKRRRGSLKPRRPLATTEWREIVARVLLVAAYRSAGPIAVTTNV